MNKQIIIYLLAIAAFVVSCKKESASFQETIDTPTMVAKEDLLRKIQFTTTGPGVYAKGNMIYEYDEEQRLISTTLTFDNTAAYKETYQYNKDGDLEQVVFYNADEKLARYLCLYTDSHMRIKASFYTGEQNKFNIDIDLDSHTKLPHNVKIAKLIHGNPFPFKEFSLTTTDNNIAFNRNSITYELNGESYEHINVREYQYDLEQGRLALVRGQQEYYHIFKMFSPIRLGEIDLDSDFDDVGGCSFKDNLSNFHFAFFEGVNTLATYNSITYHYSYSYDDKGAPQSISAQFVNENYPQMNWKSEMEMDYRP